MITLPWDLPALNFFRACDIGGEGCYFQSPGVKHVIEAIGVPHPEVDLILVNGRSVAFGYRLAHGDRVSVYPVFENLDISPMARLRPEPLRQSAFVLDVHLGKLTVLVGRCIVYGYFRSYYV